MKINGKIEEVQSKLIKVLVESNPHSKDEVIKILEANGLDNVSASKLLDAFRDAESAKNTAKNVWKTAWDSRSGVDFSTDIEKTQQREFETRQYFDKLNSECALLAVANTTEPSEINNELLNELYEQGIQENQIINPALRITFHYYSESKAKDIQRGVEIERVREYSSRISDRMTSLENQLREAKSQNETLRKSNKSLESSYKNLQKEYDERVKTDEKKYQDALSQIEKLKDMIRRLQERGIFQTIGAKLTGIFGNKRKELPEAIHELPKTLHDSVSEKMGLHVPGEDDLKITNLGRNSATNTNESKKTSSYDEWQQ